MNSPYKGKFEISQIFKGLVHKGLDMVGKTSKNIYSTIRGIIEAAGWDINPNNPSDTSYGMGLRIRIREEGTNRLFYFAHLSKVHVKVGDLVEVGTLIGVEGSTGHSTGPHLHYEVRAKINNTSFLDVSKISGIPNKEGIYEQKEVIPEKKEHWAQKHLDSLVKLGLINSPDAHKNLDAPISKGELFTMIDRIAALISKAK